MALKDSHLQLLARELHQLEQDKKDIEEKINRRRKLVCKEMERRKAKGLEWELDDALIRIAYVQAERTSYFVDKAQKLLDEETFDTVTKVVIDKDQLEAAVLAGTITPARVAKFSESKKDSPWPRVTIK